ncbi:hypothetical protein DPMN_096767, partial [Dreissena polymorpha]
LIFRLVNGSRLSQGRLEVFHNDKWGTVCDDDFDSFEAKVVCRMMGFNGNLFVPIALSSITYGQGTGQIWLDNMMCKGSECSLVHCQTKRWGDHNCQHSEDIGVDCTPEIRLVNGSRSSHGRLEVFYNNMWGTVCDDSFDILEAIVVCRMLGFTGWSSSKAISVLSSQQDITFTHITRDWNTAKLFCEITVNGSVFIRRSTTMNVQ